MQHRLDARHNLLRLYGVPAGWQAVSLGEIADVVGGGTPSRDEGRYWQGGDIPWATPTDITALQGKYLSSTAEQITPAGLAGTAASLLPAGSVLYTSRATIGAKAISTVEVATNQGFASFVPTAVNGEFLYYLLDLVTPVIKRLAAGTTFDEVSKRDIRKVHCAIPMDTEEQAAIAQMLAVVDSAIERAQEAIIETRKLHKSILQDFFYSALGVTAYADHPSQELPAGWHLAPTESLLAEEPKNGVSPQATAQPPGTPTFSIAAVRHGKVDLMDASNLKYANVSERIAEKFKISTGDVLIVRGNANPDLVGKAGRVGEFPEGCIYPDITKRIVFRREGDITVSPEYAVLAWNHPVVHNQVLRRAKTSNGTLKINNRDVKQIVMPVPPPSEQLRIVELVAALDAKTKALGQKLRSLGQLKNSLMNDLLTGRVRIDPTLFKKENNT